MNSARTAVATGPDGEIREAATVSSVMSIGEQSVDAALQPIRALIIGRAREAAEGILAGAHAAVDTERTHAEADAAAITERAVAAGRARAAAARAARLHAEAQRRRAQVLRAQREAYDRWRVAATNAAARIADEPGYAEIRTGLRGFARRTLGPEAVIVEDPAGGLTAHSDGRSLDLRLGTIAARAMEQVVPRIGGLWT